MIEHIRQMCASEGVSWSPSNEELSLIEHYAYLNILEPRHVAALLRVDYREFVKRVFIDARILENVERGKARALYDVNSTLMRVATNELQVDNATMTALKFLCTSRFDYDDTAVRTKLSKKANEQRNKLEHRKLNLAKQIHSERMELETTKLALNVNTEELESLLKK